MGITKSADGQGEIEDDGQPDDLELTKYDMGKLIAGTASAEVRRRYAEQLKDPNSFANRYLDEISRKASDPFRFSLREVMEAGDDEETKSG